MSGYLIAFYAFVAIVLGTLSWQIVESEMFQMTVFTFAFVGLLILDAQVRHHARKRRWDR